MRSRFWAPCCKWLFRFVVIQNFCYHGNVTWRLLLSINKKICLNFFVEAQWRETLLFLSTNITAVAFSAKSAIVIQDSRGSVDYKFLVCGTWIPEFLGLNSRFQCQILGSTGEKVLGFWNSELLSIGWWNYLGGIIRVLFFLWGFDSICLVIE